MMFYPTDHTDVGFGFLGGVLLLYSLFVAVWIRKNNLLQLLLKPVDPTCYCCIECSRSDTQNTGNLFSCMPAVGQSWHPSCSSRLEVWEAFRDAITLDKKLIFGGKVCVCVCVCLCN